jgi:hypothetical protein
MTCCRFAEELNTVLSPLLQFYFFCSQLIMCVVTFQVVLVSDVKFRVLLMGFHNASLQIPDAAGSSMMTHDGKSQVVPVSCSMCDKCAIWETDTYRGTSAKNSRHHRFRESGCKQGRRFIWA